MTHVVNTYVKPEGGYSGVFIEQDQPVLPIEGRDDGRHCSTCEREKEVDNHDCNVCARNWVATNCVLHTEWSPKNKER